MASEWTVLLSGVVGSQAYGLATLESDYDVMRIGVASAEDFWGLNPLSGKSATRVSNDPDVVTHEVGKFVSLYLKANPSVVELLWLDEYTHRSPESAGLFANRVKWLSSMTVRNAYLGYARSQFSRLVERGDFGSSTRKRVEKHARHLARLLHQGSELYRTGHLPVRIDRLMAHAIRRFGWEVAQDKAQAAMLGKALLALYERYFEGPSALPAWPDVNSAEAYLQDLRANVFLKVAEV